MSSASSQSTPHAFDEDAFANPGALLDIVVGNSLDGVLVLEAARGDDGEVEDFTCRLVNEQAADILGHEQDDLLGERVFEQLSVPKEETHFEEYLRVMETGEPYHGTARYDREVIQGWFDFTLAPWERGVVASFHDITEHRRTQQRLGELHEQWSLALESAQLGTWDFDLETGAISWDDQCRSIFGVSQQEEIDYEKVLELIHPDDREKVDKAVERATEPTEADSKDFEEEYRVVWPDGTVRWVLAKGKVYFEDEDEEHRAVRFTGIARDITPREKMQRALRENEAIKEAIFESALDCVITIDENSRIVEFNPAAERTFGYSREEIVGEPMHEYIVPPNLREAHEQGMDRYLETGEGPLLGERIEITGLRADGTEFPVELAITPIELDGRELFTAYLRDITDRKRWEEELEAAKEQAEAANKAKSEFLANMSHELRTPLNAVIGFSEMIREDLEDAEVSYAADGRNQLITDLEKIHSAGRQLLNLINDVLDISKIEAGEMELSPSRFDVQEMIEETESTIRPLVEENGNRFEVDCPEDIGMMHADRTKLRQGLFNLLSNAAKFTEDGHVTLRVRREIVNGKDGYAFAVEDTGIGIGEEEKQEIFEKFAQADTSLTREYEGTGLGLVITQNLCQMMGGNVDLESRKGKGSTFTMRLPAEMEHQPGISESGETAGLMKEAKEEPAKEQIAEAGREVAAAEGQDVVLIIDDDPQARELIARRLEKEGFAVATANGGKEGLEAARELHPTVITLDVMMPEKDGWAVLSELQSDEELHDIPVVMATIVEDKNMGYALGASDYLTKPLDAERLTRVLRKYKSPDDCSIMVIKNDEMTRELILRTLRKEGCTMYEAEDGEAGLQMLEELDTPPDVIILDLMMPRVDGFAFLDKLQEREQYAEIPVVVVTAKELTLEERERLNDEVASVLQKGDYERADLMDEVYRSVAAVSPS